MSEPSTVTLTFKVFDLDRLRRTATREFERFGGTPGTMSTEPGDMIVECLTSGLAPADCGFEY